MKYDLRVLVGRLTRQGQRAFERAALLAKGAGHEDLTTAHFLKAWLVIPESRFVQCLTTLGLDDYRVAAELDERLSILPISKTGQLPTPSVELQRLLQEALVLASEIPSKDGLSPSITAASVLKALLTVESVRRTTRQSCPILLSVQLPVGMATEVEAAHIKTATADSNPDLSGISTSQKVSSTPMLERYTVDLTARARAGLIDPIVGREKEIRQVVDILARRRQNNPILVGEAGVGKTAVVEGFAARIASEDVPPLLRDIVVRSLDVGALRAGASLRGDFEDRLKSVIREVVASPRPIVLFVDEAHTLFGSSAGDAADLLKPALARGELRTVAATTWSEYKRHIERDPALERRFQPVVVHEPDVPTAIGMLRALAPHLQNHHGVRILDEALVDAVNLSERYVSGRRLPDKAIAVLDTASARVTVARTSTPGVIVEQRRLMERLEAEIAMLAREQVVGRDHRERIHSLYAQLDQAEKLASELEGQWGKELALIEKIDAVEIPDGDDADVVGGAPLTPSPEREQLESELESLQGESPLVPLTVDGHVVAQVVSEWTGVPVARMHTDHVRAILTLGQEMNSHIIGQDGALELITRRIRTSRAGLADPRRPVGVFLLLGPTGVGKTQTALALAELLYGGERNLVSVNMSEYQEAHSVSGLKGAPPGYIGYGKGGVLTEAVRRNPYSLVLLDEVEKAHPDVLELFYSVFDTGELDDAEGISVNFRNCLFLLTSNLGAHVIRDTPTASTAELCTLVRPHLERHFSPSLLARMTAVPYTLLSSEAITQIAERKLDAVVKRIFQTQGIRMSYEPSVVEHVVSRCLLRGDGARSVDHVLSHELLPELASVALEALSSGTECRWLRVSSSANSSFKVVGHEDVVASVDDLVEPDAIDGVAHVDSEVLSRNGRLRGLPLWRERDQDDKTKNAG